MNGSNAVVDISDYQEEVNFSLLARNGIKGVLLKATEGTGWSSKYYDPHINAAKTEGLLVGSYHFGRNGSGRAQAQHFLAIVGNPSNQILALDFEKVFRKNPTTGKAVYRPDLTMTIADAEDFVNYIKEQLGIFPGIYGGKDYLFVHAQANPGSVLTKCWLWIAQYPTKDVPQPTWPKALWPNFSLWQYTDGTYGPEPHGVPGIGNAVDRDVFPGDVQALTAFWQGNMVGAAVKVEPDAATVSLMQTTASARSLVYAQATGNLFIKSNGRYDLLATGYSGSEAEGGKNDPSKQCEKDVGPIPRGSYKIGPPGPGPSPFSLPLTPDPSNEMCGRSGFYIHGDSISHPGNASTGCIILNKASREDIVRTGIATLIVVERAT